MTDTSTFLQILHSHVGVGTAWIKSTTMPTVPNRTVIFWEKDDGSVALLTRTANRVYKLDMVEV